MNEFIRFSGNKELLAEDLQDEDIFIGTQKIGGRDFKMKSSELLKRIGTYVDKKTYVKIDASSGNQIYQLPVASLSAGKEYYVKKTDSSQNTVTILPHAGEYIDGESSIIIELQNTAVCVACDGVSWSIF